MFWISSFRFEIDCFRISILTNFIRQCGSEDLSGMADRVIRAVTKMGLLRNSSRNHGSETV